MSWYTIAGWLSTVTRAEWISGGSLVVAALALWRSGRLKTLDRRTELRKDLAELYLTLNDLAKTIPVAVKSRTNISAAVGQGGALQEFKEGAEADRATVEALRAQLNGIARIPKLAGYSAIEERIVTAHEVRVHIQHLQQKYLAAAEADSELRKHLREAVIARGHRPET